MLFQSSSTPGGGRIRCFLQGRRVRSGSIQVNFNFMTFYPSKRFIYCGKGKMVLM